MVAGTTLTVPAVECVDEVFREGGGVERIGGAVGFVPGVPQEEVGSGFDVVHLGDDGGGVLVRAKGGRGGRGRQLN